MQMTDLVWDMHALITERFLAEYVTLLVVRPPLQDPEPPLSRDTYRAALVPRSENGLNSASSDLIGFQAFNDRKRTVKSYQFTRISLAALALFDGFPWVWSRIACYISAGEFWRRWLVSWQRCGCQSRVSCSCSKTSSFLEKWHLYSTRAFFLLLFFFLWYSCWRRTARTHLCNSFLFYIDAHQKL